MSHIHLPDGILPVWLWVSGYILTVLLLAILWRRGKATAEPRRFALIGVFAAVMILVQSIAIPPFAFHFNLSVATGIILGPQAAVLVAFLVNLILALIGHGGITVIGLNTLVLSAEMIVGYFVFLALMRTTMTLGKAGFGATFIGLASGTAVSFGIIASGSAWIDRMLRAAEVHVHGPTFAEPQLDLTRLAVIMFGVGAVGWILEGLLTAAVLVSLSRIYPDLIIRQGRP